LNDLSRAGFRRYSRVPSPDFDQNPASAKSPRTDIGTIIIHWTASIACIITLVTGLRLASDQEFSVVLRAIAPILPQGEIWSWHIISGLALYFSCSAYIVYMHRSGLTRRIALGKVRALTMPAPAKMKWGAVNVLLHWALYGLLLVQTVTGFLLYLGHGGWIVTIHSVTATIVLLYIVAHFIGHLGYGGWLQILRVFKPAPLAKTKATRSRPLLIAASVGSVAAATLVLADYGTLDKLTIRAVQPSDAPALDGVMDEAIWKTARPVHVRTMQGSNLGGAGESMVEIRAVHDGEKVYFAFRWKDPSRSLRRVPMVKKEDGWHVVGNNADSADVTSFYEDKFAVLLSRHDGFGNAGSTHMGKKPLGDKPAAANERGLHYTTDGSFVDVWQWKASRGGQLGYVDDQYFGPPRDPTSAEAAGKARYQGGYWNDPAVPSTATITRSTSATAVRCSSSVCRRMSPRRSLPSANSISTRTAATRKGPAGG
jgi:cytochrome b561